MNLPLEVQIKFSLPWQTCLFSIFFSAENTEFLEYCGESFAFHSGTMVNDDAPANTPQECQQQCVSLSTCEYWDFEKGANICRLRSDAGQEGLEVHVGYAYGRKDCRFGKSVYATECNNI